MKREFMSIEGHLGELRRRLTIVLLVYLPVTVFLFFNSRLITSLLLRATDGKLHHLVFLTPTEVLFTYIKIALAGALIVTAPFIAYQLGSFAWPGMTPKERRFVTSYMPVAVILFWMGAAFGYFFFAPVVFRFLFSYGGPSVVPMISIGNYVGFLLNLILPFAFVFELPMAVLLLTRMGVISSGWLRKQRRWAIFVIFVVAAALAPPDLMSMLIMAAPMLVLYEVSIWVSAVAERSNEKAS